DGTDATPLQHFDPQYQRPAQAGILHGPHRRVGEIPADELVNSQGGFMRRFTVHPTVGKGANIVPARTKAIQQTLMQGNDVLVFPISFGIVAARCKQTVTERHPELGHKPSQGRRATSVHADDQDRCWRTDGHQATTTSGAASSKSTNPVARRVKDGMTRNITASILRSTYSSPSPMAARTPALRK